MKYYKAQPYNMEHTLCVCVCVLWETGLRQDEDVMIRIRDPNTYPKNYLKNILMLYSFYT